jgi:glyoxylase-like metal-dependent hydrolase (beta-lactamase superfamily II)
MSLTRLDCGTPQAPIPVNQRFSDTFSYGDLKIQFVYSCYLIKHGDQYLLWDTGHSMTAPNVAPKVSIVDQLDKIGVKPEQISYVGISHYHADHTGQVASFPRATLLTDSVTGTQSPRRSRPPASISRRSRAGLKATTRSSRSQTTRMCSVTAA